MPNARRMNDLRADAESAMPTECYREMPRNMLMGGGVKSQSRHNPRAGGGADHAAGNRAFLLPRGPLRAGSLR